MAMFVPISPHIHEIYITTPHIRKHSLRPSHSANNSLKNVCVIHLKMKNKIKIISHFTSMCK